MFLELASKQARSRNVPESILAAKKSWRRQRRVHKLLTRTIV